MVDPVLVSQPLMGSLNTTAPENMLVISIGSVLDPPIFQVPRPVPVNRLVLKNISVKFVTLERSQVLKS